MTRFNMEIAGRIFAVNAMFQSTQTFCGDYLSNAEPDCTVTIFPEDIVSEGAMFEKTYTRQAVTADRLREAYLETIALQRKIAEQLFDADTLLFHGSVVAVDGQAYLFTAKSGTGKSTHTRLWRQVFGDRAVMVNDDKPFLRITEEGITVCGSPWNGKHRLGTNIQVPLKAICFLERGAENSIRQVTPQSLLPILLQQSNRPKDPRQMGRYMDMIDRMTRKTEFYRLACNMDPQAALVSYEGMSGHREKA